MWTSHKRYVELRPVRVWASICHAELHWRVVLQGQGLILHSSFHVASTEQDGVASAEQDVASMEQKVMQCQQRVVQFAVVRSTEQGVVQCPAGHSVVHERRSQLQCAPVATCAEGPSVKTDRPLEQVQVSKAYWERSPVDGFPTRAIAIGEVSTLHHEVFYDTMEGAALVMQDFARLAFSPLTSA
jgi:hypothetical protein